jgi:heme A synthase
VGNALATAGTAAGVTLVTSLALAPIDKEHKWDLVRRTVLTFVQAFIGALVVKNDLPAGMHATYHGIVAYAFTVAMTASLKSLAKNNS